MAEMPVLTVRLDQSVVDGINQKMAARVDELRAERDQLTQRLGLAEKRLRELQSDIRRAWAISRGELKPDARRVKRGRS